MTFEKFERFLIVMFIMSVYWALRDLITYLIKKYKERKKEKDG